MTFNNTTPSNFFDVQSNGRASSSPFVDIFKARDPTTSDITSETSINNYATQQKWLNTATNTLWELKNYTTSNGVLSANWIKIGGSNIVETLTGNDGIIVPPTANNINVIGDGVYLKTVGNAATSTLTIEPAGGLTTLYTENTGTATPMAGNLNVLGGTGITTVGSGNTITINATGSVPLTFNEDTGTATASANILNVHGGTGISTSGSGNTITITATGIDTAPNYTNVTHAMSPYTVNVTTPPLDYYISVDCSGGTVQLDFPNAPTFKETWVIKDRTGNAAVNNITLTTPGGTVTIDGLTTYTMNSNYQAINLLANSTPTYEVY